jgi:hypothetical protein
MRDLLRDGIDEVVTFLEGHKVKAVVRDERFAGSGVAGPALQLTHY